VNVDVLRTSDGKSNVKQSIPSPSSNTQDPAGAVSSGKKP